MRQQTLTDGGFEKYQKKSRKEQVLDEMERIIPWRAILPQARRGWESVSDESTICKFRHLMGRLNLGDELFRQLKDTKRATINTKSKVHGKVEHAFQVMKGRFEFIRVWYRVLTKNVHFQFVNCISINLMLTKKRLLRLSRARCA